MGKKKSKTRRYLEKHIIELLMFIVAIITLVKMFLPTPIPIQTPSVPTVPTVARPGFHVVETWSFQLVTEPAASQTATPRLFAFDWIGFWVNVIPCFALCAAAFGSCEFQKRRIRTRRISASPYLLSVRRPSPFHL